MRERKPRLPSNGLPTLKSIDIRRQEREERSSPLILIPEEKVKRILKGEWVNKRYSYKLIQGYEFKNDGNQKFTPPTKEKGIRRKAS